MDNKSLINNQFLTHNTSKFSHSVKRLVGSTVSLHNNRVMKYLLYSNRIYVIASSTEVPFVERKHVIAILSLVERNTLHCGIKYAQNVCAIFNRLRVYSRSLCKYRRAILFAFISRNKEKKIERKRDTRAGSLLEQMTARNWFLPFGDRKSIGNSGDRARKVEIHVKTKS